MGNSIVQILPCIRPTEREVEVFNRGYRRGLEAAKGQESEELTVQLKLVKLAQYRTLSRIQELEHYCASLQKEN